MWSQTEKNPVSVHKDIEDGWKHMDQILERIKAPVFPDRQFVITDYGAKDGGEICTQAFEKAILACHQAGGGSRGAWFSGHPGQAQSANPAVGGGIPVPGPPAGQKLENHLASDSD